MKDNNKSVTTPHAKTPGLRRARLVWLGLLRRVLHWWVNARTLPEPIDSIELDPDRPIVYILDTYALSSLLILEQSCRQLQLPTPLAPAKAVSLDRSYAALMRMKGLLIRRRSARRSSEVIRQLVQQSYDSPDLDLQLVPVSIMIGRAPQKENSLAKLLFTEGWEIGGRFRRLLGTLINGRSTFVQFSRPMALRELVNAADGPERTVRKTGRILRTHFKRVREASIGPDLSHRRTLISQLVHSQRVQNAIKAKAKRDSISLDKARSQAEKHAREIAANYSHTFVRMMAMLLSWFWNKIYNGVAMRHFSQFQQLAPGKEIIYVPCHRSHIDYVLMSYLLYQNGFAVPHVAAGVNLNLPVVGSFLRKGGAFFLRRSFRSNLLYAAVFDEYVSTILAKGVSMEYFIEGTRSRTGRLLQPKGGMLAMTVRGYLRAPHRPVLFQPIYIGYERLTEGNAYTSELSGQPKKSESLKDLFSIFKVLRRNYGQVHVSFGEALELDALLDEYRSDWREHDFQSDDRPEWLPGLVDTLARRIMVSINSAADVNPINLLAMVLLATRKHALGEDDLRNQLRLYKNLLQQSTFSPLVTVTEQSPQQIIEYGLNMGVIQRSEHKLGDIIQVSKEHAILLTYFRNNSAHLFVLNAFIACCFLSRRRFGKQRMQRLFAAVYPFLRDELFLPWDLDEALTALDDAVAVLIDQSLIAEERSGAMLVRAKGGTDQAIQLRMLGHSLLQTFQRYYITIAVLVKNGSDSLTRAELERLCILTAQRISMLSEFHAPEFYDKNLFRQFIARLRESKIIRTSPAEKLIYGDDLEGIAQDAKMILSKQIRHGIIQVAPSLLEDSEQS